MNALSISQGNKAGYQKTNSSFRIKQNIKDNLAPEGLPAASLAPKGNFNSIEEADQYIRNVIFPLGYALLLKDPNNRYYVYTDDIKKYSGDRNAMIQSTKKTIDSAYNSGILPKGTHAVRAYYYNDKKLIYSNYSDQVPMLNRPSISPPF